MTPPATATPPHTARPTRRRPAQRPPRRVSGPAGGRGGHVAPAGAALRSRGGAAVASPPLALRLGRAAARIGDARFLDRLVRGRAWIALIAVGLMGIVFVQVSMLRLNAGISRAVASAETLQRQNAELRAEISRLDSGERIADTARALGMGMPPAGSVRYLDARKVNAAAAARAIRPPKEPATSAGTGATGTGTGSTAATAGAAAPSTTGTGQAAATTGPATTPAPATTAPATTQATAPPATATTPTTTTPAPATAQAAPAPATTTPAAPTVATGQGG